MNTKQMAGILLDLLIVAVAAVCAVLTYTYMEDGPAKTALYIYSGVSAVGVLLWEIFCHRPGMRQRAKKRTVPSSLILLGEHGRELRVWQMTGHVGLLLGKSREEIQADVDLSDSDWNEAIDPAHLALNYSDGGWWAQDLSSRNGSAILRQGKEILLSPGWPVRIKMDDIILLADSIRLAVR